jgi:FdhD protein
MKYYIPEAVIFSKGAFVMEQSIRRRIIRCHESGLKPAEDEIVVEYPLTIMLNGTEFATIVCSPVDLEDLVYGFLAAEGVIRFSSNLKVLSIDLKGGFAYAETCHPVPLAREYYAKRFIGSCCGKGRQSFYFHNDVKTAKTITSQAVVTLDECFHLMEMMQNQSQCFRQTGGVHNAALCTRNQLIAMRTDIGRHNALDKIYGHWLRSPVPLYDKLVVFSGRISSEILLKTAKIGVGILLSKSAPTDLALTLADELGITTIGFMRNRKCNIYTHPNRILPH